MLSRFERGIRYVLLTTGLIGAANAACGPVPDMLGPEVLQAPPAGLQLNPAVRASAEPTANEATPDSGDRTPLGPPMPTAGTRVIGDPQATLAPTSLDQRDPPAPTVGQDQPILPIETQVHASSDGLPFEEGDVLPQVGSVNLLGTVAHIYPAGDQQGTVLRDAGLGGANVIQADGEGTGSFRVVTKGADWEEDSESAAAAKTRQISENVYVVYRPDGSEIRVHGERVDPARVVEKVMSIIDNQNGQVAYTKLPADVTVIRDVSPGFSERAAWTQFWAWEGTVRQLDSHGLSVDHPALSIWTTGSVSEGVGEEGNSDADIFIKLRERSTDEPYPISRLLNTLMNKDVQRAIAISSGLDRSGLNAIEFVIIQFVDGYPFDSIVIDIEANPDRTQLPFDGQEVILASSSVGSTRRLGRRKRKGESGDVPPDGDAQSREWIEGRDVALDRLGRQLTKNKDASPGRLRQQLHGLNIHPDTKDELKNLADRRVPDLPAETLEQRRKMLLALRDKRDLPELGRENSKVRPLYVAIFISDNPALKNLVTENYGLDD